MNQFLDTGPDVPADADGRAETVLEVQEIGEANEMPDVSFSDETSADGEAEAVVPLCSPGEGCFLDKCQQNTDCQ